MNATGSIITIPDSNDSFKTITESPEGSRTKFYTSLRREEMCAAYIQSHWGTGADGTNMTSEEAHNAQKLYGKAMREIDTNVENKTSTLIFEKGNENTSTDKKSFKRKSTDANPVCISSESSMNFDSVSKRMKSTISRPVANSTKELDQNQNERNPPKIKLRRKSVFDYEIISSDSMPLSTLHDQEPETNQLTTSDSPLISKLVSDIRASQPSTSTSFQPNENIETEVSKPTNLKRKCDDDYPIDANPKQIKSDSGVLSSSTIYSYESYVRKRQTKDLTGHIPSKDKLQKSTTKDKPKESSQICSEKQSSGHSKKSSSRRDTVKPSSSSKHRSKHSTRNDRKHSSKPSSSKDSDKSSHSPRNLDQSSSKRDSNKPSSSTKHRSKDPSRNDRKDSSKPSSPKDSGKSSHSPRNLDQSSSRRDSNKPSSSRRDSNKPSSSTKHRSKDPSRNDRKDFSKPSSPKDSDRSSHLPRNMEQHSDTTVLKNALARYSASSSNDSLTTEKLIEATRNMDGVHFNNLSNSLKTLGMTPPKTVDNNASRGVTSLLKDVNLFGIAEKHSEPSMKKCEKKQNLKKSSSEFVNENASTSKSKAATTDKISNNNNKQKPKSVAASHSTSEQRKLINSTNVTDVIDKQKTNKKLASETEADISKLNHMNSELKASSSKSVNTTTSNRLQTEQNEIGNQSPKVKELYDNGNSPEMNPTVMLRPMKLNLNMAKNGGFKIRKEKSATSATIERKETSVPPTHTKIDHQSQTVDERKPVKVGVTVETQTVDETEATVNVRASVGTQTNDETEAAVKVRASVETQTVDEQPQTTIKSYTACQVAPEQRDFSEQTNIQTSQKDVSCEAMFPDPLVEELQRTIIELRSTIEELQRTNIDHRTTIAGLTTSQKVVTGILNDYMADCAANHVKKQPKSPHKQTISEDQGSTVTSPRAEASKHQLPNSNLPSKPVATTESVNMSGSSSSTTSSPVVVNSVAQNSIALQSTVLSQLSSIESETTIAMTHPVNQTYMNRNRNSITTITMAQANSPKSSLTTSTPPVNSVNSVSCALNSVSSPVPVQQQLPVNQPKSSQILITTPGMQWTVPLVQTQNSNTVPLTAPAATTSSPLRALENAFSVSPTSTVTTTSTFNPPTPHSLLPRQPQRIASVIRRNTCTETEPSIKPSTQSTLQMKTRSQQQQSLQQSHPMQPSATNPSWFQNGSGQQCVQQISSSQIQPATNTMPKATTQASQQLHYQQCQPSQVARRAMARSHSTFMTKQQFQEYSKQKQLFKNIGSTNISVQQPVQQPMQQPVQQISNAQSQQWPFVANTMPVTLGQSQQYQQPQSSQEATSVLNGYVANQHYYQQYSHFEVQQQYLNNLQNQQWGTVNVANTAPIVSTQEQSPQSSYQQYQQPQRCNEATSVLNTSQTQEQFQQASGQQFQPLQRRKVQGSRVENRSVTISVRSPEELLQSRHIQPCSSNPMLKSMLKAPSPQIQHGTSLNVIPTPTQQSPCQQQQFQPQPGCSRLQNPSQSLYISNLQQLHQHQRLIEQQRKDAQRQEQLRQEQEQRQKEQRQKEQRQEEQRQEQLRQEEQRQEQLRQEVQRQEQLRQEEQRQEQLRQEVQRQEQLRQEEQRQEQLRQEEQRQEQLRQEEQRQEQLRQEEQRQEHLRQEEERRKEQIIIDQLKRDNERLQNENIYKMRQEQQSARNRNLAFFEEPDFWCIQCTAPASLICKSCFGFSSCSTLCWDLLQEKHGKTCSSPNLVNPSDLGN